MRLSSFSHAARAATDFHASTAGSAGPVGASGNMSGRHLDGPGNQKLLFPLLRQARSSEKQTIPRRRPASFN